MTRREQLVRAALLLLVLGVVVALVVVDRRRGDDLPEGVDPAAPTPRPTFTVDTREPSAGATTDAGGRTPGRGGTRKPGRTPRTEAPEEVPTPPPDIEAIACRKLQESVDVRVVSFNTHRSFGGIATVAQEIRSLEPDVVLLQEVDRFHGRTGGIDQVAYFADALGMQGTFSPNVVQGSGQYGTAILSRFDILDSGRFPLPNAAGGEPRGLQWAGLEIGGQEVRVYNTHLQNKLVGLRESQGRYVAGILAGEEAPTILGGDMNATANTPTVGPLLAHLVDAWPLAGSGPEGTGPNGSRIDFVMASPTLTPQRAQVLRSSVSDHARVFVDYVVPASTDCPTRTRKG
ncbi:endonuclease/exonuclease/phosphatase family protein [Nocardioides sp. Soil805]|uniref:endonuclease/exonuclease/phosphatase family protein n=1 Tax=Nocardioides sp. Soil805 TaxID=1736416 RepID=UPI0007027987|nr:endonuclease/exonuclease/phosphatase family protein [Nocardioides sp. Soil805]